MYSLLHSGLRDYGRNGLLKQKWLLDASCTFVGFPRGMVKYVGHRSFKYAARFGSKKSCAVFRQWR